jgi:integrase
MLTLYRRHLTACPQTSRRYRRCKCPIHVEGSLGGEKVRRSLDLTSWEAASDLITSWNASGQIGVSLAEIPMIKEAVQKLIADAQARNLKPESVRLIKNVMEQRFVPFCEKRGSLALRQLDVDAVREFRNELVEHYAANSARNRLEYIRAFFRFCLHSGWIQTNPAVSIKPPAADVNPTLPFDKKEMAAILAAADAFSTNGTFGRGLPKRVRAMVLLLRYSGLRISDASILERSRLNGDKLFIYTQKTGTPVWVPLPPKVVKALKEAPSEDPQYFFWNARCSPMTAVKIWERTFTRVFEIAHVKNGRIHRFRDTFAVELLLASVPIDQVSILLGHSSVKITEKHYSPWVKARQDQLEAAVRKAW